MGMTSSHVHDLLIIYGSMHSILSRTHNILSCVHFSPFQNEYRKYLMLHIMKQVNSYALKSS